MNDTMTYAAELKTLSATPVLLVALDYDGTLAPIVPIPADARALEVTLASLSLLATLSQTHVAILSGRSLEDLSGHFPNHPSLILVGSHGSEWQPRFHTPTALVSGSASLVHISNIIRAIAARTPGSIVEPKPAGIVFHYRNASPAAAAIAVAELEKAVHTIPDMFIRPGKMIFEISTHNTNKGHALQVIRERLHITGTLFVGDDITDETAFAVLNSGDVGIKVGEGPTCAPHRIPDTQTVSSMLRLLADLRKTHSGNPINPAKPY